MPLLNVAILHDVVEDYFKDGYTVKQVKSMVGLGPKETKLLDLITRKEGQENEYLPNLFATEDGAILKLADRIANLKASKMGGKRTRFYGSSIRYF